MNITLIRHPQTEANSRKVIYGVKDYPYTSRGENQMEWIKEYVEINYGVNSDLSKHKNRYKIITSPRKRAKRLAIEISHVLEIDMMEQDLVKEMDFGVFEGLTKEQAQDRYPDAYFNFQHHFDTTAIPQGESYIDFIRRLEMFIDKIGEWNRDEMYDEIILITHGGVVRELIERLLLLEPGTSWSLKLGNGCIVKLEFRNGIYKLKELIANPF